MMDKVGRYRVEVPWRGCGGMGRVGSVLKELDPESGAVRGARLREAGLQ